MKHAAMFIGNPPHDGVPLKMAQAAIRFFADRMPTLLASSTHDHQGRAIEVDWLPIATESYSQELFVAASESDHRNCALAWIRAWWKPDRVWIVDCDEFYDEEEWEKMRATIEQTRAHMWFVERYSYWKTPLLRIDPPEPVHSVFAIDPRRVPAFFWIRAPVGEEKLLVEGVHQHNLASVRTDEGMRRKLCCYGHAGEILPGWYERVWMGWTPEMEDLHPTQPANWKRAVEVTPEAVPKAIWPLLSLPVGA